MVAVPQVSVVQRWSSKTALPAVSAVVCADTWWVDIMDGKDVNHKRGVFSLSFPLISHLL